MRAEPEPPREFRTFAGLPYTWWRHLPHWHIAVFLNRIGHIRCAICWRPWDLVRRRKVAP
jgi:hypothetical protein